MRPRPPRPRTRGRRSPVRRHPGTSSRRARDGSPPDTKCLLRAELFGALLRFLPVSAIVWRSEPPAIPTERAMTNQELDLGFVVPAAGADERYTDLVRL